MAEDPSAPPAPEGRKGLARSQRWRVVAKRAWPFALILVSVFVGVYAYNRLYPPPVPPTQREIDAEISQVMASATPPPPYSAQVYQVILPSLVFIQTESADTGEGGHFGVGSGVIVNDAGDILTALHVVTGTTKIDIYFADGSQTTGEIISAEPENDIAVVHPAEPPELIVPAVLGSSGAMRVGDEAYAVGNPFGLVASLSAGVISGFDRSISVEGSDAAAGGSDPVRYGGQPRQLRRPAAQPAGLSRGYRHGAGQSLRADLLRRRRICGAHRHGPGCGRRGRTAVLR